MSGAAGLETAEVQLLRVAPGDEALLLRYLEHEAVVPVRSRRDLARRLASDRRIFALIESDGEPAIYLNVALTRAFPRSLDEILSGQVQRGPPHFAVFYGITRAGRRAKGLGGETIKRAARKLQEEIPSLAVFCTFSPLPGFRSWLRRELELRSLQALDVALEAWARRQGAGFGREPLGEVVEALSLCYLAATDEQGRRVDPVAAFHLGNGARLRCIVTGGNSSWQGLAASYGVMASYVYGASSVVVDLGRAPPLEESIRWAAALAGRPAGL